MTEMRQPLLKALRSVGWALVMATALTGCVTSQPAQKDEVLVWPPPPDEPRFYWERSIQTSQDVIGESASDRLKQFATGSGARGVGMAKPWGVAASQGRIFVGDTAARKVHVFDTAKKQYMAVGDSGPGRLAKPLDMAADAQGRLYVMDASAKRVVMYDRDGNHLGFVGRPDQLSRPSGLAVTPDGSRVFILDTGGINADSHRVVVYDARSNNQIQVIGGRGSGEGQFNLPLSMTLAPNGLLYVLDSGNFRVQVFDQTGRYVRSFGSAGRYGGQFARPKGIASDAESNIYVTDVWFGNFQIFSPEGQLLMSVGQRGDSPKGGNFLLVAGITVDHQDGRVYVIDQFFRKIDVFRPARLGPPGSKAEVKS